MMPLSSRSLGLGLLTTLTGSFGLLLPGHAAPGDMGTAADLEGLWWPRCGGGIGDCEADPPPSLRANPAVAPPSWSAPTCQRSLLSLGDSTAAIAAATVPSGDLPRPEPTPAQVALAP
jgi:hypothetical protein